MTTPIACDAAFGGWFRPRRGVPWTRHADGPDYDAAWARLLDALDAVRGGELLVLRGGENPNASRTGRWKRGRT